MAEKIEGIDYVSSTEMTAELGISRQTLWRWRTEGKIPPGHKFRDGRVLFTLGEVEEIRRFSTHIEPLQGVRHRQIGLFRGESE